MMLCKNPPPKPDLEPNTTLEEMPHNVITQRYARKLRSQATISIRAVSPLCELHNKQLQAAGTECPRRNNKQKSETQSSFLSTPPAESP